MNFEYDNLKIRCRSPLRPFQTLNVSCVESKSLVKRRLRVEKPEFAREFSQLSRAGQTRRELMRVDHFGCYPVTDVTIRVAGARNEFQFLSL